MANYLTIDVGGTAIKYALMTEDAEIIEKGEMPTPMEGLERYIDTLVEIYQKYDGKVEAMVMSAPGKIDSSRGYFFTSGALRYANDTDLRARLAEKIPVPFAAENDAKSAALAELWKGSMQGVTNGSVITLGTGIGGSLIINGQLYRGSTFAAGEFSCISTDLSQPYNTSKMWAVQNGVGYMVADYAARIGSDPTVLNGRILFDNANNGDENAVASIEKFCQGLATGLISLQTIIDVERIAIGGGISKQPLLFQILDQKIHEMYDGYAAFMPATIPEIVPCTFGNDANMIGALYHYLFELK